MVPQQEISVLAQLQATGRPTISVDMALENWIINTMQPFVVVEDKDFQTLFQVHTGKVSNSSLHTSIIANITLVLTCQECQNLKGTY